MNCGKRNSQRIQRGFTFIEIMVSAGLCVVVLGLLFQSLFQGSRTSTRKIDELSALSQAKRVIRGLHFSLKGAKKVLKPLKGEVSSLCVIENSRKEIMIFGLDEKSNFYRLKGPQKEILARLSPGEYEISRFRFRRPFEKGIEFYLKLTSRDGDPFVEFFDAFALP
ncbi:hypothetical protein HOF92_07570 [bacterium]|jgi:hypothetical protein|nr:hypothetical protein [bacterium]